MGNQPGKLQHNNQSGRPKKMVHWKSAERPSPPGRPILIPLSEQQPDVVNLRWERPKLDGGSPITGYTVEHRRMGSPHWVRATPIPVTRCEVAISGLEPGWRYQFRTFAENVVGRSNASELSDPLTVTLQRNAITVPQFIDELQDMHAVEDERIEFRVRVHGQPPPEISWFKDGYEIFSSRRTKIVTDNDVSILVIHQVALTDEGEIKCTATNRSGHVVTKARLLVQAPPKIRLPRTYEDGIIVETDEVLRLKVGIAGQPPPVTVWLHEGEEIKNGGRFEIINTERNSLLKIENVKRDDRGEYGIRATNKLGEDVTSFLVTVTARPNPPGKVLLKMSFGKSATLSWTSPLDDGGCKIGNYIVEYFRVGWNVWLKATTTRSLSTTLNDLIEGSEYKFRVKAENPYGVSDPSPESDVLFIPDPKRGITKPKSETKLADVSRPTSKTLPARGKTLSPTRPQQDAATETTHIRFSPAVARKQKPHIMDNEDLLREMSYGTPNGALTKDTHKSPILGLRIESQAPNNSSSKNNKLITTQTVAGARSPQRSPTRTPSVMANVSKDKLLSQLTRQQPIELPITPEHQRKNSQITEILDTKQRRGSGTAVSINATAALQRSAEPVKLDVNQVVRRYSGQDLPNISQNTSVDVLFEKQNNQKSNEEIHKYKNNEEIDKSVSNPIIQISAPESQSLLATFKEALNSSISPTIEMSTVSDKAKKYSPPLTPLSTADKQDELHTSNEFMLVVFDKNSKVNKKDKQDSFELNLEDAIQPPPISISSPDLGSLVFTNLQTFPLRRSVSSTELLYERAMARFYEAVEFEEAEKERKQKMSQDKIPMPTNAQQLTSRKRLGSMSEAERLSFERRSVLRRQSSDIATELKNALRWNSRENNSVSSTPLPRNAGMLMHQPESQESEDISEYQTRSLRLTGESTDLGSDYTESTASSELDSIEKFKMELMARTRSPSPRELETYHPRDMSAGIFTPYRAPTPDHAALILNRPVPLPSPDFVPKPILKRSSNENFHESIANTSDISANTPKSNNGTSVESSQPVDGKLDITKGIKSFFKRDKRSTTERNTDENQLISQPKEKTQAEVKAAEIEAKRKIKEEEDIKRQEAERLMHEEALAAVDHYSDIVSQISKSRKYHTPIYLDRDELQKAAEKANMEGLKVDEDEIEIPTLRKSSLTDNLNKIPPPNNKTKLSISEREQLMHVRETPSDLAVPANGKVNMPKTTNEITDEEIMNPKNEEHQDTRGRTRIVKVKRIIKKRIPSRSRNRDISSTSRPPMKTNSSIASVDVPASESDTKSLESQNRKKLPITTERSLDVETKPEIVIVEQVSEEEAHEKVRSALSYSTDLVLFLVACYVYLFKEARLVLPILALMIYRQLGEAISNCIPSWLRHKKN